MKRYVLDTSAILRLFVPDGPLPEGLEDALSAAARQEALLLTPELALVESVNVLVRKERAGHLTSEEVEEILDALLSLPLETVPHRPLVAEALTLARSASLTAYDAIFLALARSRGAHLLTADVALRRAFEDRRPPTRP